MAVNDPTTNFSWALPDVGADTDVWDANEPTDLEGLNSLFNEIDTDVQTEQDALDAVESDVSDLSTRITSLESAQILPVYARVTLATAPATSGATTLSFAEVVDSQGMFDAGEPTRLTVPDGSEGPLSFNGRFNLGGLYHLRAQVHVPTWAGGDDGRSWTLEIRKNGSTTVASRRWPSLNDDASNSGDELTLMLETMDEGAVGDYYEVRVSTSDEVAAGVIRSASFDAFRLPSPRFAVSRVLYSAGLDIHGNDSADFDRYDTATSVLSWESSSGKFGGGNFKVLEGTTALRHTILSSATQEGKAAFYMSPTLTGATNAEFFVLRGSAGVHFFLDLDTDDVVELNSDDGTNLAVGTASLTSGYYHIEFEWGLGDGTGYFRLWVDGVLDIDETGLTLGQSPYEWDEIGLDGTQAFATGDFYRTDDLVIQSSFAARLGDGHRIYTVLPDADAGTNDWDNETHSGNPHYQNVDDSDPDQNTSRLDAPAGSNVREEFTFTLPSLSGDIREVVVKGLFGGTAANVALGLRLDGTEDVSDSIAMGGDYAEAWHSVPGNPNGGAWSSSDLDDAVLIIEKVDGDEIDVTQVWLEIITTA